MNRLALPESFGVAKTLDESIIHDIDVEIPEGLPRPAPYRLLVTPVRTRRATKGGILLPEDSISAHEWMHQLFKIVDVGPGVFCGPGYRGIEPDQLYVPRVGELWLLQGKVPERFQYHGRTFIVIVDSQLRAGPIDPARIDGYKFYGFEL